MSGKLNWRIREPVGGDWQILRSLLLASDLPVEGVGPEHSGTFLVAVDGLDRVCGGVGLEGSPPDALLRSLVVDQTSRGGGLASHLLGFAERQAAIAGIRRLYLLTTTAADFFARCGYRRFVRADAPQEILDSDEFSSLCPESAIAMVRSVAGYQERPRR